MALEDLSLSDFQSAVGSTFSSNALDGTTSTLELTEAENLSEHPRAAPGFSLLFRHDSQHVRPQQIHTLGNEALGTLDLFLVPIAQDEQGTVYEAVVTRMPE